MAATVAVVAVLLYAVRYALLPFIIAAVVGFLVQPLFDRAAPRIGGRRWPVTIVLYLLLLGLLGAGAFWVGRLAVRDISRAMAKLPQMIHDAAAVALGQQGTTLLGTHLTPDAATQAALDGAARFAGGPLLASAAMMGGGMMAGLVLTLVLIPYFMQSGPDLAAGTIWLLPPERRDSVQELLPRILPLLRRYMLGVAGVVAYTAIVAWIGFGLVFHLTGAVLLALIVGVLEIIPAVGPVASMVLVGLTAIQQGSVLDAGLLMAFAIILRLSIDNGVGPLVLGRSVAVHPVVVMFAFVCGAMLFGIIGLLLAVPLASCLKIVLNHYYAEPIAPGGSAEPEVVQILPQSSGPDSAPDSAATSPGAS